MSGNQARLEAIGLIANAAPLEENEEFFSTTASALFNSSVFDMGTMKQRLPKNCVQSAASHHPGPDTA